MNRELIRFENITKSFDGYEVLNNLNLSIHENEFVTLLGPSGCGKTTTLRILAGFETPDSGRVIFDGEDITNLPPNKRQLNTVFQKYALFTHMSVADNIAFGLRIKKRDKSTIEQKIKYSLRLVGLEGFEDRSPASLSGGQQQRVAIARAIVGRAPIILADEPTGNLDTKTTVEIMNIFTELHKEGITVILVTHEPDIATWSERVLRFRDGQLIADEDAPRGVQADNEVKPGT